tara:strand:- start:127 stop:336 length:210 start_codon:yes stop_codon:yes gene_type:complete
MTKFDIPKPEPAGKRIGLIHNDLRVFHEARTRLITGLEKCQSAEAYEVLESAIDALLKINREFSKKEKS